MFNSSVNQLHISNIVFNLAFRLFCVYLISFLHPSPAWLTSLAIKSKIRIDVLVKKTSEQ